MNQTLQCITSKIVPIGWNRGGQETPHGAAALIELLLARGQRLALQQVPRRIEVRLRKAP